MPNRFKKCQTSWNRPNAVGFDVSWWRNWKKNTVVLLNKALIIAYKATKNYCTLEKTNRIQLETLLRIFYPLIYSGNRLNRAPPGIEKPALINGCSFIRW